MIVVVIVVVLAVAGAAVGIRHLYLRFDRPGGMTCSLRATHGDHVGVGPKFQAGWAGPQMGDVLWRRLAWPGPGVVFPLTAIRLDRERRPRRNELWRVPASFAILPVELDDGVVLELAVPRRGLRKLVGLIGGGPAPGPPRRGR